MWAAYFQLEPYPDPSYSAALICSVIANVNRGKGVKAFQPKDFLPKRKRKMTGEEISRQFRKHAVPAAIAAQVS